MRTIPGAHYCGRPGTARETRHEVPNSGPSPLGHNAPGARGARSAGLVLAGLCLAAYIISLDITIVNVALPGLVRQLGATTTGLQWVVDAYHLALAALVLAAGSLPDRLGRNGSCSRAWGCSVPPAWPDRPPRVSGSRRGP